MRSWILRVHLYGGLLCSAYLIIFGFSSLHFNHSFGFARPRETRVSWEAELQAALPADNLKAAEAIRDGLGLKGWPLPWTLSRDSEGGLRFDLERPGKSYRIQVRAREARVAVEERRKGVWSVVNSLHALMSVPNAPFVSLWGWYTEGCTWGVLFAGASGVYLWAQSGRERRVGGGILFAATAGALGLILYVVVRG